MQSDQVPELKQLQDTPLPHGLPAPERVLGAGSFISRPQLEQPFDSTVSVDAGWTCDACE